MLFWITITQHVFDEAEKATPDIVSFMRFEAPSDAQPSFPLPLREQSYSEVNVAFLVPATRGRRSSALSRFTGIVGGGGGT